VTLAESDQHIREDVLLRVENIVVEYPQQGGQVVHAVSEVSFDIRAGETLGLVGESGCGKSSLARAIMQLPKPTSGSMILRGRDMTSLKGKELRKARSDIQMIFQDPIGSLNPLRRLRDIVAEGLVIQGDLSRGQISERVSEIIEAVGLDPEVVGARRPHEFSGGQCQRIGIARAVVVNPLILLCDEPVSSLDVSVQAQIINLLHEMKRRYGLTVLFIAHDLAVVKATSDRVAVLYLGKICEIGEANAVYESPRHPYTRALLDAAPEIEHEEEARQSELGGDLPSSVSPPSGCRFRTRCPRAEAICADVEPPLRQLGPDQFAACHFPLDA
jgi:peptide/nickel transport system ATP-binding protein